MLEASLLEQELHESAGELDTTDPRLARVLSLAAADRFIDAAEAAQALWEEHFYDMRLVGYFLYGVFSENGVESLPEIFGCVLHLLRTSWEQLGPLAKKQVHADSSLKWLFASLVREL
jgi:hypothetical protein